MKNNIRRILDEKDISIYKLAQDIGYTYANTHALVNRETLNTTPIETLVKVSEALKVEINSLYDKEV